MNLGSIADLIAGFGSLVSGLKSLREGFGAISKGYEGLAGTEIGSLKEDGNTPKIQFQHVPDDAVEPRVKLIIKQAVKGYRNPKVRAYAAKLLSVKLARCGKCKAVNALTKVSTYLPKSAVAGKELEKSFICGKCGSESPLPQKTTWMVREKDWRAEVETIFRSVRNDVRYTRDMVNIDTYQSAARTLKDGAGDCDCYVALLISLLLAVGYSDLEVEVIETKDASGKRAGTWNHILLRVGLPPRKPTHWLPLDASLDKSPGWYPPKGMIYRTKRFKVQA